MAAAGESFPFSACSVAAGDAVGAEELVEEVDAIGIDAVVGRHLGELEEIDFGNSLTPNCTSCEGEISRFLAMVLPLECTITTCGVEQKNSVKWKKLKENVDKLREHPCDAYDRGEYFTTGDWHPHSRPMTWINGNC